MNDESASAVDLIVAERNRQISHHLWTSSHDDEHQAGEMADAAACYALCKTKRDRVVWNTTLRQLIWPWATMWWNPSPEDRVRELVKAGALIVAEIERLHRLAGGAKK